MSSFVPDPALPIDVIASPNHGERRNGLRPELLLLHYTGMQSARDALERLCSPEAEVSAHYLIDEQGDIVQMVPEQRRAWHAGGEPWAGEYDVNSRSIGIEIANPGHDYGYPDFPPQQIASVVALCRDILSRHSVSPERVLAHSDIAPMRKQDPGEKFPWKVLHEAGIGRWVEPEPFDATSPALRPGTTGTEVETVQRALARYGYAVEPNGRYDLSTEAVVRAFQRHFRPARIDGIADRSTALTLQRLLATL